MLSQISRYFESLKARSVVLIWIIIGLLFFLPFIGDVHLFDWDEINFAECAREMILSGDYLRPQINFQLFWEKPPLYIWFQAACMKLFGINEWSARLPNVFAGLATIISVYFIGKKLYSTRIGVLWSLTWIASLLPHFYFKSGIIDPWFNFFIFIGIFFAYLALEKKGHPKWALLGGIFTSMAILTKGPVALLITLLTFGIYFVVTRFKNFPNIKKILLYSFGLVTICGIWFSLVTLKDGGWFVKEFIVYQIRLFQTKDAGHGGFFGYHFVVLLIGCFPASIFAIKYLWKKNKSDSVLAQNFHLLMFCLFWVVLILFSITSTKIVHYSSLCYFPLTMAASFGMNNWIESIEKKSWIDIGISGIGGLLSLVFILLPIVGNNINLIRPLTAQDPFAFANMDAVVDWNIFHFLPAVLLVSSLIYWKRRVKNFDSLELKNENTLFGFLLLQGLFIFSAMALVVPNIEGYSQKAAIDFYSSLKDKDALVYPHQFKSFAHLFYSGKIVPNSVDAKIKDDHDMFNSRSSNKDFYILTKINDTMLISEKKEWKKVYSKNGFVGYKKLK
jgi:4-amino-4-deoxy-L-arabinose transferase-like glycosyltransferase